MKCRTAFALSMTAMFGGCVAGPAPHMTTPPPELPARYIFASDATDGSVATLLPREDPAFVALSQRALERAPDLGVALARIDEARANAARATANRLPEIEIGGSIGATRTNPAQFGAALPPGIEIDAERVSYAANLTARWDADLFGRLRAQQRAAQARIDAATASAQAVRIALTGEIAATVIDWRTVEARRTALSADLAEAGRIAALADSRTRAGLSPGLDRLQAQSVVEQAQFRLAALDGEESRLLGRLATLTAQGAGEVRVILMQSVSETALPAPIMSVPATLLQNRPDILAAAASLEAQDAELAAAARRRFPTFRIDADIGLLAFGIGNLFDTQSVVGSLAGAVVAPLLDFGRIAAEIDGAAAAKKAAFEAYRGTVYTALGDAETAYGLIAAADREAIATRRETESLDRAARLSETRYRAGLADFSTVSQVRRNLLASRERAAAATGRSQRARAILWQSLGGNNGFSSAR